MATKAGTLGAVIGLEEGSDAGNRIPWGERIMKVLVVEDEGKTAAYVRKGLGESGFAVEVAADGAAGLVAATDGDHDAIILDVALPHLDGWSVLRALRTAGKQTPILFLTARDTVADRVKGLELGADDYLVKPFAFAELVARVRSLMRRGPARQTHVLQVADLEIDFEREKVARGGHYIDLTPKEFRLISLLARRSGEILSRTLIAEQVWGISFDCDSNVVDVAIRRLRSKIDDPFERKLICSVRGRGYVLDAH
jgi:two-component system copper resistance phosphate regulon response regulator CusR